MGCMKRWRYRRELITRCLVLIEIADEDWKADADWPDSAGVVTDAFAIDWLAEKEVRYMSHWQLPLRFTFRWHWFSVRNSISRIFLLPRFVNVPIRRCLRRHFPGNQFRFTCLQLFFFIHSMLLSSEDLNGIEWKFFKKMCCPRQTIGFVAKLDYGFTNQSFGFGLTQ